jgi:signal transduction histidine kinase
MLQRFQDSFIRMRRFTADESHELRTLLTGLRATAELALRRPRKAHEYREALTKIVGISARIAELGEELLALARGDQYDLTISPGTVNVSAVVHEIVNEMKSLFAAKELKIELSLPPQPVIVHADASGLRRLLAALLDNAQKYTPQHGRIDVAVRSDDSEIEISVSDTGCGIPESEMSRIFDRFYRVDSSRDRETGGYGLGLAIAQQVAVAHKGTLDAVNLPSRGMVFRFRMPIIAAPSTG